MDVNFRGPALLRTQIVLLIVDTVQQAMILEYEALVDTGWVSAFYWVGERANCAGACQLAALLLSASAPLRGGP